MSGTNNDAYSIVEPLIQHYEGCKLKPYADAAGVPTIGWGNTQYQDGRKVTLADTALIQEQANALFDFWLKDFGHKVISHLPGAKPNELAAFISLAYNIGLRGFTSSAALREYLRGNKKAVGEAFMHWDHANGVVLKGLQRRRWAEGLVFYGRSVTVAIAESEAQFP